MIELGAVDIRNEDDLVRSHQTTRTIAAQLGYSTFEQTRLATAVSEISRNALIYGGGGNLTVGLDDTRQSLVVVVLDHGPGIKDLQSVLAGERRSTTGMGIGIPGTRRLMDAFAMESTEAGTRVEMAKRLPRRASVEVPALRAQLAERLASDPGQETRRLLHDIAQRDQRIADLSQELSETNRGVMALHTELEDRSEYQRQAVELRSRLVSEMGHELRTPLHSVTAISQFLLDRLDGPLTAEQEKQVTIIHEVAESLIAYVNDLLDLARTDAGKVVVRPSRFSAASTLRTLRRMVQPLARPGVTLELDGGDVMLDSDEPKVAQILRNLVANALKFTEQGTVRVIASATPGGTRFVVSDTGVGIDPEHHELIFREFAQIEGPGQARARGTGLGLPLSRRLAELLGGTLTVQSSPGEGSRFTLELPAVPPAPLGEAARPVAQQAKEAAPRAGELRALVIDDDTASRYVLKRWLGKRYQVDEAESGGAGLQRARERPDVIFLDVIMPDLTGFEVLERLKADPHTAGIPVIVYTALTLGQNDRQRLSAAVTILRKSTASKVADRHAIEDALVRAGVAIPLEEKS